MFENRSNGCFVDFIAIFSYPLNGPVFDNSFLSFIERFVFLFGSHLCLLSFSHGRNALRNFYIFLCIIT